MPTTYRNPAITTTTILDKQVEYKGLIDPHYPSREVKIELYIEVTHYSGHAWETRDHRTIDNYHQLSISAGSWDRAIHGARWEENQFGQCQDWLRTLVWATGEDQFSHMYGLYDLWDRWHLNGMNANCIHQDHPIRLEQLNPIWYQPRLQDLPDWVRSYRGRNCESVVWQVEQAYQTARCPDGYRYGSKWLVEELPLDDILVRLEAL